ATCGTSNDLALGRICRLPEPLSNVDHRTFKEGASPGPRYADSRRLPRTSNPSSPAIPVKKSFTILFRRSIRHFATHSAAAGSEYCPVETIARISSSEIALILRAAQSRSEGFSLRNAVFG